MRIKHVNFEANVEKENLSPENLRKFECVINGKIISFQNKRFQIFLNESYFKIICHCATRSSLTTHTSATGSCHEAMSN